MADKAIQTRIAEHLQEFKADFAPRVAALMRPVLGNEKVSKAERQRRWWQKDPAWPTDPVESRQKELMLLTGLHPDGTPVIGPDGKPVKPLTPEDVGILEYPNREVDARAAGKGDERKMALHAREMSALGPPPPDPLSVAPPTMPEQGGMV